VAPLTYQGLQAIGIARLFIRLHWSPWHAPEIATDAQQDRSQQQTRRFGIYFGQASRRVL